MDLLYWFADTMRANPTLALFLTLGLGFFVGRIKIGSFSLGSVTAVLLVGVLVGQLNIPMGGPLKTVFFLMFLFSIGYSVGPDFFKSLRGSGAKQALFAVIMSAVCFATVVATASVMNYSKGDTIGLFSGSQTCSSLLGVGSEALSRLGLDEADLKNQLNMIPVCYAVTYIFGTLGTVIILGNFGPRLLGGMARVRRETLALEKKLNAEAGKNNPAYEDAMRMVDYRAYTLGHDYFKTPRRVREVELMLREHGIEVYIDRVRHNEEIFAPRHDDMISVDDDIVVCGRNEYIVNIEQYIGTEISDSQLLSYPLDKVSVVVARKDIIGRRLSDIRRERWIHGVVIRDAVRGGKPIEITTETTFAKGDRLTILGRPLQVTRAGRHIGHVERPSIASDLMFVGLAIFIGGLFGAISIYLGSMPVSFGSSGGALVAGLVFGWLRSKRPTYGQVPPGALWLMNNLGLNVFIAVVGIEAAPSFVAGIKAVGPMLFVAGAVATTIPVLFGLWLGSKVFKFNPAITLGCVAGTRTCTAALGAAQNAIGSTLPAIGYTVTYAVSNILLVVWGMITVFVV